MDTTDTTVDLLQIKIEAAKEKLPKASLNAINAVDWKATILEIRADKGYSFSQIEDLEIETELLLCGLINIEDYPKELQKRMGITPAKVDELINAMNEKVFTKIREELAKNIEKERTLETNSVSNAVINKEKPIESREELLRKIENPDKTPSILGQKLSGTFQNPTTETEHTLENITKNASANSDISKSPTVDPYREVPE
ncbi:MAG: hypothetical protein WC839_02270 [Candidatus Paceibacterota bacterium]